MQFKSVVSETFNEQQQLEYKSMDREQRNQFLQDLLQGIKGEAIDQIIVIVDRVTKEGTRYQINEPLQTKKYD
jgi:archaellum biogenesis ATPase FlaH